MTGDRPNLPPRRRYSEADAAKILGVDRRTLYRWRMSGQIKFISSVKSGRVYYEGLELLRTWATR